MRPPANYHVFKKWQDTRHFYPDIGTVLDDETFSGPGYVYADMAFILVDSTGDYEMHEVIIGNVIQSFDDLERAERYLWQWHSQDNCHINYDDLSHLSTTEEVK